MIQVDFQRLSSLASSLECCEWHLILLAWKHGWLGKKALIDCAQERIASDDCKATKEDVLIASSFRDDAAESDFLKNLVERSLPRSVSKIKNLKETLRLYFLESALSFADNNDEIFFEMIENVRQEFNYPDDMRFISQHPINLKSRQEEKEWMSKSPKIELENLISMLRDRLRS